MLAKIYSGTVIGLDGILIEVEVDVAAQGFPGFTIVGLPIAVGILSASGMIKKEILNDSLFLGELSLRGDVRRVPGAISIALLAKSKKIKKIFVSRENISEVILVDDIEVYLVDSLINLILHLNEVK